MNWALNAPVAGTYGITFVYTQNDMRDMDLTVNGVKVATQAFNNTASWDAAFASDIKVDVTLNAGNNSVKLSTNGQGGPNFDKIIVQSPSGGAGGAGGDGGI